MLLSQPKGALTIGYQTSKGILPPTCDDCPRMSGTPTDDALSVGATNDCQYERKRSCTVLHRKDEGSIPNRSGMQIG